MSSTNPGNDGQWSDPQKSNKWDELNTNNTPVFHGYQQIATASATAPIDRLQHFGSQQYPSLQTSEMILPYYPTTQFTTGVMPFPSPMGTSYAPQAYYHQPPSLPMPQLQPQAQQSYHYQQPVRYSHQPWAPESVPMPSTSYYSYNHGPTYPQDYGHWYPEPRSTYPDSSVPAASSLPEQAYQASNYALIPTNQPWIPPQFPGYHPYPPTTMSHSFTHPPSIPSIPQERTEANPTFESHSHHHIPLHFVEQSIGGNEQSNKISPPPLALINKPSRMMESAMPISQPIHPAEKDIGDERKQSLPSPEANAESFLADAGRTRRRWTTEEDQTVVQGVLNLKSWDIIASMLQTRTATQVRLRYQNYLQFSSDAKRRWYTPEEDRQILAMAAKKKRKWSELAKAMGRSHVAIKNRMYFLTRERKGRGLRPQRSEPAGSSQASSGRDKDDKADEIIDGDDQQDDSAGGEEEHTQGSEKRKRKVSGVDKQDAGAGQSSH